MYSAENLSAIELAILRDIASGYHSKEIAVRLGRSKPTIAVAFGGGEPRFRVLLTAFVNIAVWSIGLYYVTNSIIIRMAFSTVGATGDYDALLPSMLSILPFIHNAVLRGLLAAINPFLLGGVVLQAQALRYVCGLKTATSYGISVGLAVAAALASGALSALT